MREVTVNTKIPCEYAYQRLSTNSYIEVVSEWLNQHPLIISRLAKEQSISNHASFELLLETAKFLRICANSDTKSTPSEIVDRAWHTFILFTADYREFCDAFFGQFIDHYPGGDQATNCRQYHQTIKAIIRDFGSADKAYWPRGITISGAAPCGACSNIE